MNGRAGAVLEVGVRPQTPPRPRSRCHPVVGGGLASWGRRSIVEGENHEVVAILGGSSDDDYVAVTDMIMVMTSAATVTGTVMATDRIRLWLWTWLRLQSQSQSQLRLQLPLQDDHSFGSGLRALTIGATCDGYMAHPVTCSCTAPLPRCTCTCGYMYLFLHCAPPYPFFVLLPHVSPV